MPIRRGIDMVPGLPLKFKFRLVNKATTPPTPISEDIVNDISLDLSSTSDGVSVKNITIGNGITMESTGVFLVDIPAEDTIKLPKSGNAILKGVMSPCSIALRFKLGRITSI